MPREPHVPLFLWIAAAVLIHLGGKDGAERATRVVEERLDLQRFAAGVRQHLRSDLAPQEVTLVVDEPAPADDASGVPSEPEEVPPEEPEAEQAPAEPEAKPEPKKPAPEPEQEKPQELKVELKKTPPEEETKPPQEIPEVSAKNRIAVQQHVEDKNQPDNPDAEFIGNEANRVAEQTRARITSTTQNDPAPTPGKATSGPRPEPGNSADESRVAQDEDTPGVAGYAPNERTGQTEGKVSAAAAPPPPAPTPSPTPETGSKGSAAAAARPAESAPARSAQADQPALRGAEGAPDLVASPDGTYAVPEAQRAQQAQAAKKARKRRLPPPNRRGTARDLLGFGASGTTASGINLNLTPNLAVAAIGRDTLRKEKRADAERRRSAHLGSWKTMGIEKWRAAIENYAPSVKPGNQTALNTARVPFASYLNVIHNRLHPLFADQFLASLSSFPGSHPVNQPTVSTNLEIALSQDDGRVIRMGVTKASGITMFDIAALESVQRASPFGPPPPEIVSPDGNVYFHWEFHRNPDLACSTYFARPFILKVQPKTAPPNVTPPTPPPGDPRGDDAPARRGWLLLQEPSLVERLAILR